MAGAALDPMLDNLDRACFFAHRVLGNRQLAQDAVQDACLRYVRRGPEDCGRRALAAYFMCLVRMAALDLQRSEIARKAREEGRAVETDRQEISPQERVLAGEAALAARREMEKLPQEMRLAICLCCEEGFTQREAAEILEVPETTVSKRVEHGLSRLRQALAIQGFGGLAAGAVGEALGGLGVPAAPAPLVAKVGAIAKGAGGAATAAAKGGIAVKIIAGVVAAGVLAGAVAVLNSVGAGFKPAPTTLASPPAAAPAEGKPAPINEYKGMQEREEVFEFAEKPKVTKEGDKWIIAFTSKGKCDATVTVLGPDGKIVRHLASGVLGVNAPHPFQQNSLSQKIEWDGLTDTFQKAPAGCKVRVSLGLKPQLDRNLLGPAQNYLREKYSPSLEPKSLRVATDGEGNTYVAAFPYSGFQAGQVYDKAGKYLRTFWPPPAKDVEKVGVKLTTTKWGDKTPWVGWHGPFRQFDAAKTKGEKGDVVTLDTMLAASGLDAKQFKESPWPGNLPQIKPPFTGNPKNFCLYEKWYPWFICDPERKWINLQGGLNEETGIFGGGGVPGCCIGFDGLYYGFEGVGDRYGTIIRRVAADGKKVPFDVGQAKNGSFYSGFLGTTGGCFTGGLDVTENGTILVGYYGLMLESPQTPEIQEKVLPLEGNKFKQKIEMLEAMGAKYSPKRNSLLVFDRHGNRLTTRAVENLNHGHGNFMDRDGNIYLSQGGILPVGQKELHGVAECPGKPRGWGGSILKFRGLGDKYPIGKLYWDKKRDGGGDLGPTEKAPPEAVEIAYAGYQPGPVRATGLLWAYGGISNLTGFTCECNLSGFHLDHWARSWVPNNGVSGVMVVDSNGNFVMRVGQYGNVDDEGIRFAVSIRAVWATDDALYAFDEGNVTLSKILLKYAAEETVPAP